MVPQQKKTAKNKVQAKTRSSLRARKKPDTTDIIDSELKKEKQKEKEEEEKVPPSSEESQPVFLSNSFLDRWKTSLEDF
jgi:hypothetical protein